MVLKKVATTETLTYFTGSIHVKIALVKPRIFKGLNHAYDVIVS